MATITLTYDGRSSVARKAIDNLMSLGVFSMEIKDAGNFKKKKKDEEECPYNPEFMKKIEESKQQVREGKVHSFDEIKQMLNWK